jgi:tetratricopeptide (TPR) repeat protein
MSKSNSETSAPPAAGQKYFALICLVLALGTMALYWPITHHPFIEFDDTDYILGNPNVTSGLSATNFVWAFTTSDQANWHPLTWLSHQADCALFGVEPGWHHLVNLLYHVANTLLLFIFLRGTTGAVWRSALVAALFAWHPMHVESVAWASERKDMLSTFFWLLTLLAYWRYARAVGGSPPRPGRVAGLYGAALGFCACGLMSKPMVVTLPFALGLLDLWPLNRIAGWQTPVPPRAGAGCRPVSVTRLVLEKIPFLVLAVAGSLTTYLVQSRAGAVAGMAVMERLANAVLAYARYTAKLFWPTDLAVIYPHPRHWPLWLALIAVGLLLVWTFLCVYQWRKCPYLAVGWFWFVGTLVPTIGLVQVGAQAMADRYTYIPSIGLFVAVIWGVAEYSSLRQPPRWLLPLAAGAVLAGCLATTARQISLWSDSVTLFRHAIIVTTDNYVAENCLGKAYEKLGDNQHALACYELSVETESRFPYSQFNLAIAQLGIGQTAEALKHLEIAAALEPQDPDIQFDLGIYFSQHGSWTNAVNCFSNALVVRPNFARAQFNWGNALANLGRPPEAAAHFRDALRLEPTLVQAKTNLDRLLTEHPEAR